ncbi:protein kinase family protein [Clostridium sp. D2Q-11]|uniref:Protein kinase family protein n=1 Tax=Anaeromonas frigoriresistens TaxID=2683708 RepID=A0A942Z7T1_9FIRM|nr:protein kinase [Anaeromonas frigoriresistens]MBS4537578.1 protein kinase family protein [Anaeromonas frigoriresistens]
MKYIDVVKGKWNKNIYYVENCIGQGSVGYVYKVVNKRGEKFALKSSEDLISLTKEYKMLNKFSYISAIPKAYELDDGYIQGKNIHFIIMEYIEGISLKKYLLNNISIKKTLSIILIITEIFQQIYDSGYIYWDIKLENILVDRINMSIRVIDFGGVSKIGQSIKEYTPTYNIHCWRDKPYYDDKSLIFSINMILISLLYNKEFNPLTNSIQDIIYKIKTSDFNDGIKKLLINGLIGDYNIEKYKYTVKKIIQKNMFSKSKYCSNWIDALYWGSIGMFIFFIIFTVKMYIFK